MGFYLTGDRHAAEDLLQSTFLAVMQAVDAHEPGHPVLPWLCGILANRARDYQRRTRLRRSKLPHAGSDRLADPVEEAAAVEVRSQVAAALQLMPEPYRQVLTLHLEHGLGAKAIADLKDQPPATVRSQIRRGLDKLRRALPVGMSSGLLACPRAKLDNVRTAVLAAASQYSAVATVVGVTSGTVVMKKVVAVAAVAALVVLGFWTALRSGQEASEPQRRDEVPVLVSSETANANEAVADVPPRVKLEGGVTNAGIVSGQVLYSDTMMPVDGAKVVILDGEFGEGLRQHPGRWQVTCDADGRFRQAVGDRTVVQVEVQHDGCQPTKHTVVAVSRALRVLLQPVRDLTVQVLFDSRGDGSEPKPVANAMCRLTFHGWTRRRRIIVAKETNSDGLVTFPAQRSSVHLVVEKPGLPAFSRIYELAENVDSLQVVLPPAGRVTGRVVDSLGRPLAGVVLAATYRPDFRFETADDGLFRLPHVARTNALWTLQKPGFGAAYLRVRSTVKLSSRLPDLQLHATANLTGRVRGFAGKVEVSALSQTARTSARTTITAPR